MFFSSSASESEGENFDVKDYSDLVKEIEENLETKEIFEISTSRDIEEEIKIKDFEF